MKEKTVKIGIIGVGRMGLNVAKLLIQAKHDVYVCDLDPKKVRQSQEISPKIASPSNAKQIAFNLLKKEDFDENVRVFDVIRHDFDK